MLAVIPYETFPIIKLGPLELRTFGLMVGIGVLLGAYVAARYIERHTGVIRDDTYRLATRMVIAGVIGARITWDITHWSDIGSPLDLIAVWKGGLQFSGGFIAAVIVGFPTFRTWTRAVRWSNLDGYALGLTIGLAFGRIGCTSVGEHFGSRSSWLLAVRYDGGSTRENVLGPGKPLLPGMTFHNTAIYELLFLLVLFGGLLLLARRRPAPGTLIGVFCLYYGLARGASDFLRVNDETTLGLTGAQWMCVVLIPVGILILTKVRRSTAGEDIVVAGGLMDETRDDAGDASELEPAGASDQDD
ncbi:MAG: phosphatidylglycerol---prolipoprotein diacylglyceryl transferase [Acidimicrobiaceae bacterium]